MKAVVQRLETEPERFGGLRPAAIKVRECRDDQASLALCGGHADAHRDVVVGHGRRRRPDDLGGQALDRDLGARQDVGAIHRVLELPHVPGPRVRLQYRQRLCREPQSKY